MGERGRTSEELLGAIVAGVGVVFVVASVALSAATFSGCGACWPGSCADGTPTNTPTPTPSGDPTPTPTLNVECDIPRDVSLVDPNLYQSEAADCPRILLDPEGGPLFDTSLNACGFGTYDFGEQVAYSFQFDCDASTPWIQVVPTLSGDTLTLAHVCPDMVPVEETFIQAPVREQTLFDENRVAIVAATNDWEEACIADDASQELLEECNAVCSGQKSLYDAMVAVNMLPSDPVVVCYLALYASPQGQVPNVTVTSANGVLRLNSRCGCEPTEGFVDCMAGVDGDACYTDSETYDQDCGSACWVEFGSGPNCSTP